MAHPPAYQPQTNFSALPSPIVPANKLDVEIVEIAAIINALRDNARRIQRDDGKLADASVRLETLDVSVAAAIVGGWKPRGPWQTLTAYGQSDYVEVDDLTYVATVPHTSGGDFPTDKAAGKWMSGFVLSVLQAKPTVTRAFGNGNQLQFALTSIIETDDVVLAFVNDKLVSGYTAITNSFLVEFDVAPSLPPVPGVENVVLLHFRVVGSSAVEAIFTARDAAANSATSALNSANAAAASLATAVGVINAARDAAIALIAADVAAVAANAATVAADKGIVAADKATVAADKALAIAAKDASEAAAAATLGVAAGVSANAATVAADKLLVDGYKDEALAYAALAAESAAIAEGQIFSNAFVAKSRVVAAQPIAPTNLDTYILPAAPTGAQWGGWAQHDIVRFYSTAGAWARATPIEGSEGYVQDANEKVRFDGATWGAAASAALNEDGFGSKSPTLPASQLSTINYILGSKRRPARDFGILQNTENMAPWEVMVAAISAGDVTAVDFHAGLYVLDDVTPLSPILGGAAAAVEDYIAIRGIPGATRLQVAAGGGTVGTIFKLGSTPNFLRRFLIDGFDISFLNTPDAAQAVFDLQLARDAIISRIGGRGWGKALKTTQAGLILLDQWNIELGAQAGAADAIFDFNNTAVARLHRLEVNGAVPGNLDADGCFISVQSAAAGANIDTFEMQSCGFQLFSKTGSAADGRPVGLRVRKPSGSSGSLTNVWVRESYIDHTTVAAIDMLVDAASVNSNSRVLEIVGNRFATDSGKGATFDNQSTDLVGNAYTGLTIDGNTFIIQTNSPAIEVKGSLWNDVAITNNKFRDRFGLTADRFNDVIDHVIAVSAPNVKIDGNTVTSDDGNGYVRIFDGSSASVVSTANDTLTLSSVTTFNPTGVVNTGTDLFTMAGEVFQQNQKLLYRKGAGGTVMAGLTDGSDVYVRDWAYDGANTTFKLAATEGGAAINITSLGAGAVHELIVGHGIDGSTQWVYSAGGGTAIAGLTEGQVYIPRDITADTIKVNQGGAAAIDLTAVGVGASHSLTLKTRFRAFVKAIGAGVSNLKIGAGNKIDCLTYFDEATYPTTPFGNNHILDPKIVHEETDFEWQVTRESFEDYPPFPSVVVFDGASASIVSAVNDTLTLGGDTIIQNQPLLYSAGGGTVITGLADATTYYARDITYDAVNHKQSFKLAATPGAAAINITAVGVGAAHSLTKSAHVNPRKWKTFNGSLSQHAYADPAAESGLLTMNIPNTGTKTMAVNGQQIIGPLVYRTVRGMVIEGSLTHNDITDAVMFFGFTDQNTALEMPMEYSGSVIANATDAAGFLFDVGFASNPANWRCVAANTGVVRNFDSAVAQVNSVYKHFRLELDYRGNADFFINRVHVGHITTAVSAAVLLAPTWAMFSRNGGVFGRLNRFKTALRVDKPV